MTKHLVYLPGLRGPEAQIWHGEIVKSKNVKPLKIVALTDEAQRSLDDLIKLYPYEEPDNGTA